MLKHGTLSVGFIGLAETLVALTGKHHGESPESQKLGLEIIGICGSGWMKNLRRLVLISPCWPPRRRVFPAVCTHGQKALRAGFPAVTDKDYYTNSFHIPVYYNIFGL